MALLGAAQVKSGEPVRNEEVLRKEGRAGLREGRPSRKVRSPQRGATGMSSVASAPGPRPSGCSMQAHVPEGASG